MAIVLKGLRTKFVSLKSTLFMLGTPLSYSDLLNKYICHEFIAEPSIVAEPPSPLQPSVNNA